jgi:hypothetical protein
MGPGARRPGHRIRRPHRRFLSSDLGLAIPLGPPTRCSGGRRHGLTVTIALALFGVHDAFLTQVQPGSGRRSEQFWAFGGVGGPNGTWHELEMARDDGLLTEGEYGTLLVERDRRRADPVERLWWQ